MSTATFRIYQINMDEDKNREIVFLRYDRLIKMGKNVDFHNYQCVYTGEYSKEMTLDYIYEKFNIDHPADFHGHSLSVSDIVVLPGEDGPKAYYVDSIGFVEVSMETMEEDV